MEDSQFKHYHKIRTKLYTIVFGTETKTGRIFDIILLWVILMSIIMVMLESVKSIDERFGVYFSVIEWTFTILFTIEYFLRIFISKKPSNYTLSYLGIIDLIALIPTYLTLFVTGGSYLVVIRAIRLLRVFRILKLTRYLDEAKVLSDALQGAQRKILIFMGAVSALVMITGTLMYLIEGGENGFSSIPRSIYWAVVTVTTVGYGDIAPQTVIGQAFATLLMLTGYAIIAVPTGIMTSEINKQDKRKKESGPSCSRCFTVNQEDSNYCSKCGESLRNFRL